MQRVLIIGCGGAGKTTFALRLADKTGLPVIHLDSFFWSPGWKEPDETAWRAKVAELVRRPAWIMDGNYSGTLDERMTVCDTVVFLDVPTWLCVWRIIKRRFLHAGRSRPDMAKGCHERLNWEFVHYVLTYRRSRRTRILQRLERAGSHVCVFVLRSRRDIEEFFASKSGQRTARERRRVIEKTRTHET